jgi:hypothetical protein
VPDVVDRTQDFLNKVRNEFVGYQVEQPLTTYIDNTTEIGPNWPPGSKIRTGNEIKARGWCKIETLASSTGQLQSISVPGIGAQFWLANLTVDFRYQSWTHGERWLWPQGIFVDNVWNDISPQGTIRAILTMQAMRNGVLRLECMVDPNHDDDPGHFIRDRVAPKVVARLDFLAENFTGVHVDS